MKKSLEVVICNDQFLKVAMETIKASEFKATCLELLDRVHSGEIDEIAITKRGRVVAVLRAPGVTQADAAELFGCLRGSLGVPDDLDLTSPVFDGPINAETGLLHE